MTASGGRSLRTALALRRQVIRGAVSGTVFAVGLLSFFVLIPGTQRPTVYYVALAFVVAVTSGGLVTLTLLAYRVHRLAKASSEQQA